MTELGWFVKEPNIAAGKDLGAKYQKYIVRAALLGEDVTNAIQDRGWFEVEPRVINHIKIKREHIEQVQR